MRGIGRRVAQHLAGLGHAVVVLDRDAEAAEEALRQTVPVGRVGTPYDIARAVAFFAAEDAGFVTGQVLYVSGGPHG